LPGFKPVLGVKRAANTSIAKVGIVHRGSAAADAGIKSGDIIEQFGDVPIGTFDALKAAVSDTMPGERVGVWINRQGKRIRLRVEIGREED
jgi:S1-C subfamily serine protease